MESDAFQEPTSPNFMDEDGWTSSGFYPPGTPESVSGSFRGAGDRIPSAVHTPERPPCERLAAEVDLARLPSSKSTSQLQDCKRSNDLLTSKGRPVMRTLRIATTVDELLHSSRSARGNKENARSHSSLESHESATRRFREHGDVYQSDYRSVTSCSFGKDKRKICEHDIKQKREKPIQEVIYHDMRRIKNQERARPQTSTMGNTERGHWSQDTPIAHNRWARQVKRGHHSPAGALHVRDEIFNRTAHGNQTPHDFFDGKTTFGTAKKWYQRKTDPNQCTPGPGGVRPPLTKIKGGRFNRHHSLSFLEQMQQLSKEVPGPGMYEPQHQNARIRGGKISQTSSLTHWQILDKHGRSIPGPAEYCRNMPWAENNSIYLPGAGRMPEGGRVMFEKIQPGVEKMIPIALHGDNVAPIYLVRTPVMEALHRTPGPGDYESIRTSWY